MRKSTITLCATALLLVCAVSSPAGGPVAENLTGVWLLSPTQWVESGQLTFNEDGTYVLEERHATDGVLVTTTGQFLIDESATPVRIDLCLEQCGGPGAEWTTRFGILRFISDQALEIRTSPDATPPAEFSTDEHDRGTMKLTRGGKY